jgi:hypothetical protein
MILATALNHFSNQNLNSCFQTSNHWHLLSSRRRDSNIWNGSFEFQPWLAGAPGAAKTDSMTRIRCSDSAAEWISRIGPGLSVCYFSTAKVNVAWWPGAVQEYCCNIMIHDISVTCLFMQPQVSLWVLHRSLESDFGPQWAQSVGIGLNIMMERTNLNLQTFISMSKGLKYHNSK